MKEASMADRDPVAPHVDVAGYLLGVLSATERQAFEAHLPTCPSCRQDLERLNALPRLLAQASEPVEVPPDLEARVLGAVAREPARRPVQPAPVIRLGVPRVGPWWRPASAIAVMAALVVAFLGGLGLGINTHRQPAPAPQPVVQTIHLVGAGGSGASGTAVIRSTPGGKAIELTVRGLPPPPPGHFYTCWLVANDDTLQHQDRISVGSFTTSGTGPLTLRWETAADLARFPNLGVTLEPNNGNPLHQGPKVLTAAH
jgi:anti-sigma-K factor RskA